MQTSVTQWESPLGTIQIEVSEKGVRKIFFTNMKQGKSELTHTRKKLRIKYAAPAVVLAERSDAGRRGEKIDQNEPSAIAQKVIKQLSEHFTGKKTSFDFPLDVEGTDFQKSVWEATAKIPFGQVTTYGDIAKMIGKPRASRAVGSALGKNQIGIVVPCHRVLASDGSLGGFAWGLDCKEKLLSLEK